MRETLPSTCGWSCTQEVTLGVACVRRWESTDLRPRDLRDTKGVWAASYFVVTPNKNSSITNIVKNISFIRRTAPKNSTEFYHENAHTSSSVFAWLHNSRVLTAKTPFFDTIP
jgi:hypothetical protein